MVHNNLPTSLTIRPEISTTNLNGNSILAFDGSANLYVDFEETLNQPNTIITVIKNDDESVVTAYGYDGYDSGARHIMYITGDKFKIYAGAPLSGSTKDTNWHIFNAKYDSSSSEFLEDRTTSYSGETGSHNLSGLRLGAAYNSGLPLTGKVAEVLIFNGELTATQNESVHLYLYQKWNINLGGYDLTWDSGGADRLWGAQGSDHRRSRPARRQERHGDCRRSQGLRDHLGSC